MEPSKREMTERELSDRPKSGPGSKTKFVYDFSKLSDGAITYVREKVSEILTGTSRNSAYSYAVFWGTEHEDEAREYFAQKTGFNVEKVGFFKFTDHAGGSPDGFVNDDAILEIKCPFDSKNHIGYLMLTDQWDLKALYFDHWVQCQANMLFTDRNMCHFVAYDPRMKDDKHKMVHIQITPDNETRERIVHQIELAVKEKLELLKLLK